MTLHENCRSECKRFVSNLVQRRTAILRTALFAHFCLMLQHNKQREELHRLQEKHPEIAAKARLQSAGHQKSEVQSAEQTDTSEDEDEV